MRLLALECLDFNLVMISGSSLTDEGKKALWAARLGAFTLKRLAALLGMPG